MTESWKGLAKAYHLVVKQEDRIARNPEWNDHDKAVAREVVEGILADLKAMVEKENPEAVQQLG